MTTSEPPSSVGVFSDPEVTLIRLVGEIDYALSDQLDDAYAVAVDRGVLVQLDLYQVSFMDSIAVGFIARLVRQQQRQQMRLTLVGVSKASRETLALSGIADQLDGFRVPPGGPF